MQFSADLQVMDGTRSASAMMYVSGNWTVWGSTEKFYGLGMKQVEMNPVDSLSFPWETMMNIDEYWWILMNIDEYEQGNI